MGGSFACYSSKRKEVLNVGVPKKRGECYGTERPCIHVGCRYHLGVERTGFKDILTTKNVSEAELDAFVDELFIMPETCCLDVIDKGEATLQDLADILKTSRERIRQIQECKKGGAVRRLRHHSKRQYLSNFIEPD